MSHFSASVVLEGRSIPSPTPVRLHAGPLTMLLEPASGFLRRICLGDDVLLNGVYAAVRDRNWGTVEPVIRDMNIDQAPGSFSVRFDAECRSEEINFLWHGTISGDADGLIRYTFDGHAKSDFLRNRIGFCVLHGADCAGRPCLVEHSDGSLTEGTFPRFVSPRQPFKNIRAITHWLENCDQGPTDPAFSKSVEVRMEGEVFEMEDQRNWTDASFKTYCTPLELPYPVAMKSGARVRQTVQLRLTRFDQNAKRHFQRLKGAVSGLTVEPTNADGRGQPAGRGQQIATEFSGIPSLKWQAEDTSIPFHPLPRLGVGMASHGLPLNQLEIKRLNSLKLDHLRCDLTLLTEGWETRWREALKQAGETGCRLQVAIHLNGEAANGRSGDRRSEGSAIDQLTALAKIAEDTELVDAWLVFIRDEKVTGPKWTELARSILGKSRALIVGGTDANFAELNRDRPATGSADGISWPINPQVHAFDDLSLVETLDAQWDTVASARQFFAGDLLVSPVTLKPRFNPNATAEPPPVPPDVLPPQVDVRQMSLFGAAWTLGSMVSLSRAPLVRSITYHETTGWRGIMEWSDRPRLPHKFVTRPDWVFPVYFVFALMAGHDECREVQAADRARHTAFLVRQRARPERVRLLAASFDRDATTFELPRDFEPERSLILNHENAVAAMREPDEWLNSGWREAFNRPALDLPPLALAAVDGRLR